MGKVITELNGKLHGMALRVPVTDGSVTDLVAKLKKNVTVDEINDAMKAAAAGPMKGVMEYTEDPIVSSDIVGNPHSCIIDADCTMEMGGDLVKVVGWYDNEWGYSNRAIDAMAAMAAL